MPKAAKAAKAARMGTRAKSSVTVRTKVHFYKPKTLKLARAPKYSARSAKRRTKMVRSYSFFCLKGN